MALLRSAIRAEKKGNNIKRRLLLPPGYRMFLLKRGGETKRFTVVLEVLAKDGGYAEYSDWRQQLAMYVATLDATFPDKVAQTSHFACGVGYGVDSKSFDVYVVDPQRRDVVAPTGNNRAWKFFLTRDPKEVFTLP